MEAVGYQNSFRAQMLGDDQEERPEGQGSGGGWLGGGERVLTFMN